MGRCLRNLVRLIVLDAVLIGWAVVERHLDECADVQQLHHTIIAQCSK